MAKKAKDGRRRDLRTALTLVLALILCPCLALLAWVSRPTPPLLEDTPFSACVRDANGGLLRLGLARDGRYRVRTSLAMLPREAVEAVVRYEDRYFWWHPGVNPVALARAGLSMLAGGRRMGGSTLTMQVARLKLGLRTGSARDKVRQILWALRYEWHFAKQDILEAYFSLAPYGGNVESFAAASLVYFHKEPCNLATSEILSLVPVPQNPVLRRPAGDNPRFLEAAARLQEAHAKRRGQKVLVPLARTSLHVFSAKDLPFAAPHLATELLQRELGEQANGDRGFADSLGNIATTLDPALQRLIERQLRAHTARLAPYGVSNAAAVLVHWPSRKVLALAGSASFFDEAAGGQIDATDIRRSPGSTLKPFIYALALEQGRIHPRTLLLDMPKNFAGYEPENFDGKFQGPLAADEALRQSRNVPAITLANSLTPPGLYGFLQRCGVNFLSSEEHYGLSLVLGGAEVTARELATLYAMLADGGVLKPLVYVGSEAGKGEGRRVLSPEAAFVCLDMLKSANPDDLLVLRDGTRLPLRLKTGTSNGLRDAWTCGVFGEYVLVVWVGNCDNSSNPLLVGAMTALPLFRETARAVAAARPTQDRHNTPPRGIAVTRIEVCRATGDTETDLCPAKEAKIATWFIPGVSPVKATGILRRVVVNARTGQRLCPGEQAESKEVVGEFWPSELAALFARAGIAKPAPPRFGPLCRERIRSAANPPRILSPKEGLSYHVSGTDTTCPLVLAAHADAGTTSLYWFCDSEFAGVAVPGENLVVRVLPGDHELRVVDDTGLAAKRIVRVRRVP